MPSPRTRSKKPRTALIVGGSVVAIAILALVIAKLVMSDDGGSEKPAKVDNAAGLTLELGDVEVQSAGPTATISKSVRQSVLDASQSYVDDAILGPLEKGKLVTGYEKIFDTGVRKSATGRDQAALTEVRTGAAKPVEATATKVRLDGLGDPTGKVALVAATFGVDVTAKGVKIKRLTELTFANEDGEWVVTAYKVGVQRSTSAATTSAVAHAGTGAVS